MHRGQARGAREQQARTSAAGTRAEPSPTGGSTQRSATLCATFVVDRQGYPPARCANTGTNSLFYTFRQTGAGRVHSP